MAKKMLIDATHAEETRVVVLDGNKIDEFDFESINKKQLAGNIYLARVTRVEPSLQAAFVEYGGNRHGFLAFSEIHPDYYQIPVADREALLVAEARADAEEADAEDAQAERKPTKKRRSRGKGRSAEENAVEVAGESDAASADAAPDAEAKPRRARRSRRKKTAETENPAPETEVEAAPKPDVEPGPPSAGDEVPDDAPDDSPGAGPRSIAEDAGGAKVSTLSEDDEDDERDETKPETVGAEDAREEIQPRRERARHYKIQEVIKKRQILLVQVVKEERGNKGAALTTYLSLAGRYCVLMPNTARGGGISRKITNAQDRRRLKEIANELDVPQGMGLIVRTAGADRTRAELKRDYEYLLRQWDATRERTLSSIAPTLIYEEGSLIKRSIRDLYTKDIDAILVEGEEGYREAKDYMKMLTPSHAKNVQPYREKIPLLIRHHVESQLALMFNPVVQLRSGGYIVIGITEALVAIDVNSGRSTREHSIEETALKTNLEAAEEVARQLRLRDLAGLIVIDFIDMDDNRNNRAVEKRFKDRLKNDRARLQIGRISAFGLMEMSRQRLRPGMLEASTRSCPHCHGGGLIRSDESMALSLLRELEEEGIRNRASLVKLTAPVSIANYLINQKRGGLSQIEERYGMTVYVDGDPAMISPDHKIERIKTAGPQTEAPSGDAISVETGYLAEEAEEARVAETSTEEAEPKKRRRRRRRKSEDSQSEDSQSEDQIQGDAAKSEEAVTGDDAGDDDEDGQKKRRRGRRGGRRRRKSDGDGDETQAADESTREAASAPDSDTEPNPRPSVEPEAQPELNIATDIVEPAASPADPDAGTSAEEVAPKLAPKPAEAAIEKPKRPKRTAEPAAPTADPDTGASAEEVAPEPVPEPAEAAIEEPKKPKRTGWWSLKRKP